jgi:copper chaperone
MQTELLKVTGMACGGCTASVTRALKAIPGVDDVKVSLSPGEATVQYDERLTSPDRLKSAVKGAGYGVEPTSAADGPQPKGCCCV